MILPFTTYTYKHVEIDHFVFIWCLAIKVMHHSDYYIDTGLKKMVEFNLWHCAFAPLLRRPHTMKIARSCFQSRVMFQPISTFENMFNVAITV